MTYTGAAKTTVATAAVVLLGGLAAVAHGLISSNTAHSISGGCLTLTALGVIALTCLRQWIVDTSEARRQYADATRSVQEKRDRYTAAQAALEVEQGRLNRDMADERRRLAAQLIAEREAMRADFEEKRAALITETMEATILMMRSGKMTPETAAATGRLIPFPQQQPQTARERSREHGVVSP